MPNVFFKRLWMVHVGLFIFFSANKSCLGQNCFGGKERTPMDIVYCVEKHINYNKAHRPSSTNTTDGPTNVTVDIVVVAIGIHEEQMEFTLDFYLRQVWYDPALVYSKNLISKHKKFTVFNVDMLRYIWTPDTYIDNGKLILTDYQEGALTNEGLRIYPDGKVFRSTRLSMTLYCHMGFHWFPLDTQTCYINISSYAHLVDQMTYHWGELSVDRRIKIPKFSLNKVMSWENWLQFSTGNFTALTACFQFSREIHYYLLGFYIPAVLIVILSWISFWISPRATPARVSLAIITVLAMAGFLIGDRPGFPKASYARAFDVYMITCFLFVFGCLVEFAIVHYVLRDDRHRKKVDPENHSVAAVNPIVLSSPSHSSLEVCELTNRSEHSMHNGFKVNNNTWNDPDTDSQQVQADAITKKQVRAQKSITKITLVSFLRRIKTNTTSNLDETSKLIFPIAFAMFNITYWWLVLVMRQREINRTTNGK